MKDKFLKIINYIILIGAFAYVGYQCAKIAGSSDEVEWIPFAAAVVGMYVDFYLHIILHESGHLLAGLLTGYRFVSFRIGSFVWIKNQTGKIELRRMKLQGTGGQCLMCPPNVRTEECPYKLYHLAGGLANVVLGLIGLILAWLLPKNVVTFILFEEFGVLGIALGLSNLIPNKASGMQNDGYNLLDLSNNLFARKCMNLVLSMNALLTVADSYKELPEKMVSELKSIDFKKADLSNSSIANAFNFQIGLLFAEGNYEKAYELYKYMAEYHGILSVFANEARCECLFLEILDGTDGKTIEKNFDKNLQRYVKMTAIYPSRQRLLYAYYKLHKRDETKAEECYQKLQKTVDTFVIKAEAKDELELAKKIKRMAEAHS